MKTFKQTLKEDQRSDLKYRNTATKIAVDVLKYLKEHGFDREIPLNMISSIPETKYITIKPIKDENRAGNMTFSFKGGSVSIDISIDSSIFSNKTLFLKVLIHEIIHALDILRMKKDSIIQMVHKVSNKGYEGLSGYANDPMELNAFYQEAIFDIELSKKKFNSLQSFIKYTFDQFPLFFRENLTSGNKQRIFKRLAGYYQTHFA